MCRCMACWSRPDVRLFGRMIFSVAMDSWCPPPATFRQPVYCGEEFAWRGTVSRVTADAGTVEISWQVTNDRGHLVQTRFLPQHFASRLFDGDR